MARDTPPADAPGKPAEESRLRTARFRAGLMKRGLTELLELHLQEFPHARPDEAVMMMRELRLAEYTDASLPLERRREAIGEANKLLHQLIEENSDDPRRFEWRFALSHSLIYDQAEPFFTSIIYRGGSTDDRRRLVPLTTQAVETLRTLLAELGAEYERIDSMSIKDFERLEAKGYVTKLDRLQPRAEYLLQWAFVYDAVGRVADDPTRVRQLNELIEWIESHPAVLGTPHQTSRVQVQAFLLAGMSHRLLNNHQRARGHLDRAIAVAQTLDDPAERKRVNWAVTLALIERIRTDRDGERFDSALSLVGQFRQVIADNDGDNFGLRLVAALLERSVYRSRADAADRAGRTAEIEKYRYRSWRPLARLARQEPQRRDELYSMLYQMIGADADPQRLDAFERCALVAGLLFDASESAESAEFLLDRAVRVGERFIAEARLNERTLVPEVLYNVAVAKYRRGQLGAAGEVFLRIARDHSTYERAEQAAALAVQLGAEAYGDARRRHDPKVGRLYRNALDVIVTRYGNTDASRYWRFFYGQLLEELEEYDLAVAEYAQVDRNHEHYLKSVYSLTRCSALALQQIASGLNADRLDVQRRTDQFFSVQRRFASLVTNEISREQDRARLARLRAMLGEARLIAAEVQVLPRSERHAQALVNLEGFEEEFPDEKRLAGRVWRVRLLAYEKLGRLDQAATAIPAYIAADPENAGATLQNLYLGITANFEQLGETSDTESARRKAELALLLAQQIHEWAARRNGSSTQPDGNGPTLQLAEANLRAAKFDRARELFESLAEFKSAPADGGSSTGELESDDLRIVYGHAEALFQLGKFAESLAEFNRLAMGLSPSDPVRWRSLLRDLQCRTELNHPPRGIVNVIRQQKHLYPKLGGPVLSAGFEKLLRENQRRAADTP